MGKGINGGDRGAVAMDPTGKASVSSERRDSVLWHC